MSVYEQLSGGKGQIINLGAGFDTLYWRLRKAGNSPANFVELDFPSITAKKCYHIKKQKQLIDMLNTEGILLVHNHLLLSRFIVLTRY